MEHSRKDVVFCARGLAHLLTSDLLKNCVHRGNGLPHNVVKNVVPPAQGAVIPTHASNLGGRGAHGRPSVAAKRRAPLVTVVGIPLFVVGALLMMVLFPWPCTAAVNGVTVESNVKTSVQDLVAQQDLRTRPGNLLAVDGSVLEEGGGELMHISVNGEYVGTEERMVHPGDVIEVTDGDNTMESFVEEARVMPASARIEGVGAIHRYTHTGQDGEHIVRTGSVSGKTVEVEVTRQPVEEVIERFNVDTGGDMVVALTFDDGPWDTYTQEILDILAANGAHATFFTVGERVEGHEDTVRQAAQAGHQICTHSWDHAAGDGNGVDLGRMTEEDRILEITRGQEKISEVTGQDTERVIRVPGGNFSEETASVLEPYVDSEIGWNIDTQDWQKPGVAAVIEQIMNVQPGNIVLMHDGGGDRTQTVEALRTALPQLVAAGYRFVTIDQLLEYVD